MVSTGQKILLLRKKRKITQQELADLVGVKAITIMRWEKEISTPDVNQLQKIAKALNTPISYFFDESSASIKEPSSGYTSIQKIPVISWVHANNFHEIVDNYPPGYAEEWVYTTEHGDNLFALRIINNCMEPEFREGDIIIVEPQVDIYPGNYVVIADRDDNKATFKQFKQYGRKKILHPLNPKYEDIELDSNKRYTIIGKIIEKIKKYK